MEGTVLIAPEYKANHKIQFHGQAKEYFKIWIVNLLLTVVTLGVYSAWAKVRTRKYFYGNAELVGGRFDYHADPIKILKGRIVVGILFAGYVFGTYLDPIVSIVCGVILAILAPLIFVKSAVFNLGNTSYRGLRLGFKDDVRQAYYEYFKAFLITILTVGIGAPVAYLLFIKFKMSRIRVGAKYMSFDGDSGPLYMVFLGVFGIYLLGILAMFALLMALGRDTVGIMTATGALYVFVLWAIAYARSAVANFTINHSTLGDMTFYSKLKTDELAWLYISNLVACVFTLGLLVPWAMIRSVNYRLAHTEIVTTDSELNQLIGERQLSDLNANAEAAADFWDFDFGL